MHVDYRAELLLTSILCVILERELLEAFQMVVGTNEQRTI